MIIDVSMSIKEGSIFRLGTPAVQIGSQSFHHESEGEYESVMISFSAHTATHVDLVFTEKRIEPERMIGNGKLIDVSHMTGREIRLADVKHNVQIESGDYVFFRTDWSEFVGTDEYYNHPELSLKVVDWLISRKVGAVGIDALGLGRGRRHGEYDRLLGQHGIFVIENLANLVAIPERGFIVYCLPLKIENTDAIPARVLVQVADSG
jgi:kynurenine formamidase